MVRLLSDSQMLSIFFSERSPERFAGRGRGWPCLVLALLASCGAEPPPQFKELLPEETGVYFRNDIVETQHNNILTYEYTYNGGGVAAGDLNNDGLADLYFVGNSVPNKLFLNRGDWKFEDVTDASGVSGRDDWRTGVSLADVNGDGWLDIYVCYSGNALGEGYNLPVVRDYPGRANQLFINNGGEPGGIPTFTEKAAEYGERRYASASGLGPARNPPVGEAQRERGVGIHARAIGLKARPRDALLRARNRALHFLHVAAAHGARVAVEVAVEND